MADSSPIRPNTPHEAESLSGWEVAGLENVETHGDNFLKISEAAKTVQVRELSPAELLQHQTLPPIVKFFIWANSAIGAAVFILAIIEKIFPPPHDPVVTDKVIIALVGGLTAQVAAVIIAAFKGLFGNSGEARAAHRTQDPDPA